MRRQGNVRVSTVLPRSSETSHNAHPGRPDTASNVVRACRVSDNGVSKGAAPSIVGEEKVHAPVSSIRAGAEQVALFTADTEAGLCCNGGHGVTNSVVCGGGAAAVRTT